MIRSVLPAAGTFAVTNVDDVVLLALFFARAGGRRVDERRIVAGQYLGFGAILAVSLLATAGMSVVAEDQIAYLGLLPIVLGLRAAVASCRSQGDEEPDEAPTALGVAAVAGITFANGGDNIGVYGLVFSAITGTEVAAYVTIFLVLVTVWCLAGRYLATRPLVAKGLARWGQVVLPIVLLAIGAVILIEGGAFGL